MSTPSCLVTCFRRWVPCVRNPYIGRKASPCWPSVVVRQQWTRPVTTKSTTPQAHKPRSYLGPSIIVAGLASCFVFYHSTASANAEAPPASISNLPSRPTIRLADVKSHGEGSDSKWVVRGTKVYDITDWVPAHPGGEVILRAAGGTIDKYWDIFSIHKK